MGKYVINFTENILVLTLTSCYILDLYRVRNNSGRTGGKFCSTLLGYLKLTLVYFRGISGVHVSLVLLVDCLNLIYFFILNRSYFTWA